MGYHSLMFLSKRKSDTSKLLSSLERDPKFYRDFLQNGFFTLSSLSAAVDYIVTNYNCGATEAEEVINHLIRGQQVQRSGILSNRIAQTDEKTITIPGTSTHAPRTVPVKQDDTPPPNSSKPLTVDADPSDTEGDKVEDLTKPVVDTASSRQQKLLNSIKALKVAVSEVAKDMYSIELLSENVDKVVSQCIDSISKVESDQTAETVKQLASPLIGVT